MIKPSILASETELIPLTEAAEGINRFERFLENVRDSFLLRVPTIVVAIVILVLGVILSRVAVKLMGKAMDRSRLDLTVNRFVRSAVKIVLYVLVVTVALTVLGVPMTSIITVIGTAGVAIGLALQNSLSNLAGGFLILFAKPFRVGNFIRVGGDEGTVESISILYTKLLTPDHKAIFIPNGTAANAVVMNYSDRPTRRVDLEFTISYDEDVARAVKAIETAIGSDARILREEEKAPFIRMSALRESDVAITVRLWVKTEDYWAVYFDTLDAVRREFLRQKIEIPYRQLDIHMR
ncbi:MAG: mechanosensitive ion channel [Bacteroides sp.]|nr:mechanosensitive ion channel [Eubacterium sp.]MCM1418793.1 mechanosensitive ion channel [Roseburia sp.]MCM1462450.1 mechanosensitive ion channel [Bacteroides sp.]